MSQAIGLAERHDCSHTIHFRPSEAGESRSAFDHQRLPEESDRIFLSSLPPFSDDAGPSFRHEFLRGQRDGDSHLVIERDAGIHHNTDLLHFDRTPHNSSPLTGSPGPDPFYEPPSRSHITERTFLQWYPRGNATVSYLSPDGETQSLCDLHVTYLTARCPLLSHAFEDSRTGPLLFLDALTSSTALPFVRYLYTGTYALVDAHEIDIFEAVPTSLLLHCQLYHLATVFDLPDLWSQANVNVMRQCEFGCSSPDKPIDLCEAIEFAYAHLRDHSSLIETIVNYCVSCFLQHGLSEDERFSKLAHSLRPFHQDLCRISMERGFESETAAAIIQMPFESYAPVTYASREDMSSSLLHDVVYHFHGDESHNPALPYRMRLLPKSSDGNHALNAPSAHRLCMLLKPQEPGKGSDHTEIHSAEQSSPRSATGALASVPRVIDQQSGLDVSTTGHEGAQQNLALFPLPPTSSSGFDAERRRASECSETSSFEMLPRVTYTESAGSMCSPRFTREMESSDDDFQYISGPSPKKACLAASTQNVPLRPRSRTHSNAPDATVSVLHSNDEEANISDWSLV